MKALVFLWTLLATTHLFAATDLDATDVNKLIEMAGQDVSVVGIVQGVGSTKTDSIRFINFSLAKKQGFTAVVFQRNYGAFPEGFETLKGKRLRITGKLEIYSGQQPQIEVRGPEQIEVLPE